MDRDLDLQTLIARNLPGRIDSEKLKPLFEQYGYCRIELKRYDTVVTRQ